MRDKLIVFVTMSMWDEPHRGRHHFANALADHNTVVWIDRPFYWKDKSARVGLEHIERGLHVLHPGRTPLPYRLDHKLNWGNRSRLKLLIRTLKSAGFDRQPDIIWIYDYKAANFARHFRGRCIRIYFCNDYFGEYAYEKYEPGLCAEVDHVFCTSPALRDRLVGFNPNCTFLPHGVWLPAAPVEYRRKPHPENIGYVGTLRQDLDLVFLNRVLDETDLRLVMAGPVTECLPEQKRGYEQLLAHPRVDYLGNLKQDQIPAALADIDICTVPYKLDQRQFMFPLKLFDYLAAGKPVAATPYFDWPGPYDKFVSVWQPGQDLRMFFEEVYERWDQSAHRAALALAADSTWARRTEQVAEVLGLG